MGSETVLFVGAHYEVTNPGPDELITKYYMAGTTRIAMRKYTIPQPMKVEYMLSDHLGSTSLTADADGNKVLEIRYKAWGEVRATWTSSPSTTPAYKMPLYTFTNQASYMDDPLTSGVTEGFGLMFYNARWYDPYINHFVQADTIVPQEQGTQAWDRYAYVNNNPVIYTDISGHGIGSSRTVTYSSVSDFITAAQGASGAIGFVRGIQSKLLIGGATLVGVLGLVGGALAGSLVGATAEGAIGGAAILGGGAYAIGSETLLDQYDQDLSNLTEMQSIALGYFEDGATELYVTVNETQMTLGDLDSTTVIPVTVTVQTITICSDLGECKSYTSSFSPSNQHAINRFFVTPDDDDELDEKNAKAEIDT